MKLSSRTKALFICISIVFFIYSVSLVVPFIFILVNSFKSNLEFIFDVWAFPKHFSFSNYKFVFENYNMGGMFANSLWVTIMGTLISMISCCVTAYVLARYKFHGSKILISVAMAAMIIPSLGTLSATYKLMRTLKLIDNIFGILVLYAGPFGTNFLLMYSYFKTVSWTYAEAAKMDASSGERRTDRRRLFADDRGLERLFYAVHVYAQFKDGGDGVAGFVGKRHEYGRLHPNVRRYVHFHFTSFDPVCSIP